ncbi:MAG: glycosyltransferase family A protein [Planctomycetota bacterium]
MSFPAVLALAAQPAWSAVWFWMLLLIAFVWLRRHFDLNRARRDPVLRPEGADGSEPLPPVTVLVAAKDEESNIEQCLAGLRGQDYPNLQIVAVDDRSGDATRAIICRVATADPRVTPVAVDELPTGWWGKSHALHVGMRCATGEWLCFVDADCRFHSPRLIAAAMRLAARLGVEFLSVLPQLDAHGVWEKIVQPPAGGIMVFWFPPQKVNDPRKPQAYANGAFMLMRRSAYERLGGHAAVRAETSEDMQFARRAKRLGVRLHVVRGGGLYSVRMYAGLREIWKGWTRIFYGSFAGWPRLSASAAFLLVFSLLPVLSLLLSPFLGSSGWRIASAALITLLAQQTVLWRFYRLCAMRPAWALTYPLGAALCLGIIANAMRRLVGVPVEWRGTRYARGTRAGAV